MSEVNSLLSGPVPGGGVGWVEENRIYLEADNLSHIFKDPVVKTTGPGGKYTCNIRATKRSQAQNS